MKLRVPVGQSLSAMINRSGPGLTRTPHPVVLTGGPGRSRGADRAHLAERSVAQPSSPPARIADRGGRRDRAP